MTTPRGHQVEARRREDNRPRNPSPEDVFALLMEYGAGKSKVVCDEWGEREYAGDLQDLLVFAGAGSYRNWDRDKRDAAGTVRQPSEFRRHLSADMYERMRSAAWVSGKGVTYHRELEDFIRRTDPRRPRALVVNIEAVSTVQKARDLVSAFLDSGRRCLMAVDESTSIKTHDSKRTDHTIRLGRRAAARRILTGLVVPNSPMDLYSQFEFLDPRVLRQKSYFAFRSRYAVLQRSTFLPTAELERRLETINGLTEWPSGREELIKVLETHRKLGRHEVHDLEVDYRNLEELNGLLEAYSYRVLKKDCLDLPPKVYMPPREVEMTDEQRKIYSDLKRYAMAELEGKGFVTATMVITQMLRLQQLICGHVVDEDGNEHDVPERRSADLMQVLGEHSGKAIIWVPYLRTLAKLRALTEKEFGEGTTAEFSGRNTSTRLEDESRWLTDPRCRFMYSTPAAGGRGNTWLPGTLECFYANDYNLELRLNAEDRPHRDGQTHPVAIQDWVCPGTVEEKVIPALRAKLDIASLIMGDDYKEWVV